MRDHGDNGRAASAALPASQAGPSVWGPVGSRTPTPLPHTLNGKHTTNGRARARARVIGYCRVSTEGQATNGISLTEQRSRIRAYVAAHGLELVRIAADNGRSGRSVGNRPGLLGALRDLEAAKVDGLVICRLDRLSRTTTDILGLVERAGRGGWQLHSIAEHLDTASSHGRFVVGILGLLAQMEREQTAERTRDALAELRRQGKRISGRAPFGFQFVNGNVVKAPEEQKILASILRLRAEGLGARKIARALGRNPRTGRFWSSSTVGDLLRRVEREK